MPTSFALKSHRVAISLGLLKSHRVAISLELLKSHRVAISFSSIALPKTAVGGDFVIFLEFQKPGIMFYYYAK